VANDDLVSVLTQFHRDVMLPDVERVVRESAQTLRDDMNTGFDHVYKRLDTIETETQLLRKALSRLETRCDQWERRLENIENELQRVATHAEVEAIRAEITKLKKRLDDLETPA
jgi:predicted  nucleic acid-binding Zn-ribbon protein